MGKSTSAKLLNERGLSVADTDAIARDLVEPGQPALAEIEAVFGGGMIGKDGRLCRNELARHVFSDASARRQLEGILHPRIRAVWQKQIEEWRAEGRLRAAVVIPLLFETDAAAHFDAILCVACSATTQRERLLRRGWGQDEIEKRLRAQWPAEKKMELSNYVVWTEAGLDAHAAQLDRIIR